MKRREIFEFRFAGRGVHALGGAIAGIGSIVGGAMGSGAAKDASKAQAQASKEAIDEQKRQFDINQANLQPWLTTGKLALNNLAGKLALNGGKSELLSPFTGADLENDPGYKFARDQGEQAINRAASAAGRYEAGSTLKELARYGNDYAGTKFNEAFNRDQVRKNQVFNMLSGVAGSGQTAANQVNAAGTNMANNVSDLLVGAGNAKAAGIVGGANAMSAGIGGAANSLSSGLLLQKLLANGGGPSSGNPIW